MNGYKEELYLKQDGNQVRGWMGVNGVNLNSDTITGTVNGNEILFTQSYPTNPTPQEWRRAWGWNVGGNPASARYFLNL